MIGTFTTRCFASRADFEADTPLAVHVSANSFTNAGLAWMWKMMVGGLRQTDGTLTDHLGAARLVVGNGTRPFDPSDSRLAGDQTAQAELDAGYPATEVLVQEGIGRVRFVATFGEDQAAFDWQERGVVTAQGVLIDRAVQDQGRKVLGAVWQLMAELDLTR
jgi:hypothetical protein